LAVQRQSYGEEGSSDKALFVGHKSPIANPVNRRPERNHAGTRGMGKEADGPTRDLLKMPPALPSGRQRPLRAI